MAPGKKSSARKAPKGKSAGGKKQSMSAKAGLQFPVGRCSRYLRKVSSTSRLGAGAAVYMAAVLEYIQSDLLELAGKAAEQNKKHRILPRHIQLAIQGDEELRKLLGTTSIPGGGVMPNIHEGLLPKQRKAAAESK
jgi:histone H2A